MTMKNETAGMAFERNRTEALRRLTLLTKAVCEAGRGENVNWGHVGDLAQINEYLAHALHMAGVAEFVED